MNENMTIPAEDLDARYAEAEEICHHSANVDKIAEARDIFRALGDHRESKAYLEKCEAYLSWGEGAVVEYGHVSGAPIRWRVLEVDGRNRLLMAEKPVAYLPYNTERDHANWSQCSLRRWLNKDFMEQCFTLPERMDILLTPVLILQMACLGLGCGVIISALTTKYRDLAMLIGFGMQLWMYATPVAYDMKIVPVQYLKWYMLNPMTPVINAFRHAFLGLGTFDWSCYGISWAVTLTVLALGVMLFSRVEKTFMDTI